MLRDKFVYSHASKYNMLFLGRVKHAARHRPHDRWMHWGQRLREEREARGLTQKQVGAYGGVTKGAVSQWELGGSIKPENLFAIAERLGVSPKWLAIGKGPKKLDESSLNQDEVTLIEAYRNLPKTFKAMLMADVQKYLAATPKDERLKDGDSDPVIIPH